MGVIQSFVLLKKTAMEKSDSEVLAECLRKVDIMDGRLEHVETRLDRVETRLDRVETRLDQVEIRLDRVETTLDRLEIKLVLFAEHVDARLDQIDNKTHKTYILLEHMAETMEVFLKEQNDINAESLSRLNGHERAIGTLQTKVSKLENPDAAA